MSLGTFLWMLLLQFFLIFVNAFFASTELAVMQLSANKLRRQIEEGDKAAARILKFVEEPSNFLSTIQIAITLVNFLGGAIAADNFAGPLSNWVYNGLGFQALPLGTLNTIALVVITLIVSYFTLVLGELVPKQVALHKPYQVAKVTTGVIGALAVVMKPVIKLLSASTTGVLRLFGIRGARGEETVTEDEIRMMVDVGHESGTIDSEEKEMIDNVFDLDNTIARDVMTHRVDVVSIEADAEPDEIVAIIAESGMSRFPVYDDSLDDILGILNSRTYLLNLRAGNPKTVRELLRPACFVPETVQADVLLRDMQQRKDHLALVLDEYGGFSGIVTMEDLIEEIVGNIYDEFDAPAEPDIYSLAENLWRIAGDTEIEMVERELGVELPTDREYDTLGGLVFSQLSSIPQEGEEVEVDVYGMHIHTEPIEDHHVEWAKVSLLPPPQQEPEVEEDRKKERSNKKEEKE
ncbi:hemolysin family protein [Ruminococcaceae bacterium OttesenSCG-928-A16]|nr:hemolysin family protein [Ruminococcaceae bacterium OttesenSCG-928-A16]